MVERILFLPPILNSSFVILFPKTVTFREKKHLSFFPYLDISCLSGNWIIFKRNIVAHAVE